ncbi:macrocin O-methyltransferase [Chromatiales bacterium (ex Bugula neritina AB1)]|nr:macrocin O-methyltransferase [Chromatiales bacterium (ex Bugula neritina AB1)]
MESSQLYVDLLKRCLANTIYCDTPQDKWSGGQYNTQLREYGRDWPSVAHTMIGTKRLNNLHACIEDTIENGIEGDLLEAGVWRGGATILMKGILNAHGVSGKKVWVADSFEGLPVPDEVRYPADTGDIHHQYDALAISEEEVKGNFEVYDLLDEDVVFLKGWFEDTLHKAPIRKLSVLRVDGDMYMSTINVLESLYDKVSIGGYVIIDDYHAVPGCKKATDDFRANRSITRPMMEIDGVGTYWQK